MLIDVDFELHFQNTDYTIPDSDDEDYASSYGSHGQKNRRFPVEILINFLQENKPLIVFDSNENEISNVENTQQLLFIEKLIRKVEEVVSTSHDGELLRCLKSNGWTGTRFAYNQEFPFDFPQLLQSLLNLYLKQMTTKHSVSMKNIFQLGDMNGIMQLFSFVPNQVMNYISNNPYWFQEQSKVHKWSFVGACVLIDISGFTAFSGEMCSQGVAGLDELRQVTDEFLGKYVDMVYQFGGDVMAFAGDALLCVFAHENHVDAQLPAIVSPYGKKLNRTNSAMQMLAKTPHPLCRALDCAYKLKDQQKHNLSTHIAVSYGKMSMALLGNLELQQFVPVLNGTCVSELSTCINHASARQVAITPATVDAMDGLDHDLRSQFIISPEADEYGNRILIDVRTNRNFKLIRSKSFRIKSMINKYNPVSTPHPGAVLQLQSNSLELTNNMLPDEEENNLDAIGLIAPRPAVNAISSNSLHYIGELRRVTTMFLSLDSYSPELHKDPATLQPFFSLAQQELSKTGGYLRQFLVDDKGCVFIAMWGIPSFTYANNCSRALHCAVSILVNSLFDLQLRTSIGITTGDVFCGVIGSSDRSDYVGIGTDVNTAARLMAKAKGRVLLDGRTYKQLDNEARTMISQAEPLKLKGFSEMFLPYQYVLNENIKVSRKCTKQSTADSNTFSNGSGTTATSTNCDQQSSVDEDDDHIGNILRTVEKSSIQIPKMIQHETKRRLNTLLDNTVIDQINNLIDRMYNIHSPLATQTSTSSPLHSSSRDLNHTLPMQNSEKNLAMDSIQKIPICIVAGAAGTAKFQAADYFRYTLRKRGVQCLRIHINPGSRNMPYSALKEILSELLVDYISLDSPTVKNRNQTTNSSSSNRNVLATPGRENSNSFALHESKTNESNIPLNENKVDLTREDIEDCIQAIYEKTCAIDEDEIQIIRSQLYNIYQIPDPEGDAVNNNTASNAHSHNISPSLSHSDSNRLRNQQTNSSQQSRSPSISGPTNIPHSAFRRLSKDSDVEGGMLHPPSPTISKTTTFDAQTNFQNRLIQMHKKWSSSRTMFMTNFLSNSKSILALLIKYILNGQPTGLIIDDIHNCDELSWREIKLLADATNINFALVMTMKTPTPERDLQDQNNFHTTSNYEIHSSASSSNSTAATPTNHNIYSRDVKNRNIDILNNSFDEYNEDNEEFHLRASTIVKSRYSGSASTDTSNKNVVGRKSFRNSEINNIQQPLQVDIDLEEIRSGSNSISVSNGPTPKAQSSRNLLSTVSLLLSSNNRNNQVQNHSPRVTFDGRNELGAMKSSKFSSNDDQNNYHRAQMLSARQDLQNQALEEYMMSFSAVVKEYLATFIKSDVNKSSNSQPANEKISNTTFSNENSLTRINTNSNFSDDEETSNNTSEQPRSKTLNVIKRSFRFRSSSGSNKNKALARRNFSFHERFLMRKSASVTLKNSDEYVPEQVITESWDILSIDTSLIDRVKTHHLNRSKIAHAMYYQRKMHRHQHHHLYNIQPINYSTNINSIQNSSNKDSRDFFQHVNSKSDDSFSNQLPIRQGLNKSNSNSNGSISNRLSSTNIYNIPFFCKVNVTIIVLKDLSYDQVHEILCEILGKSSIPAKVVDSVLRLSGGNAFWCRAFGNYLKYESFESLEALESKTNSRNSIRDDQSDHHTKRNRRISLDQRSKINSTVILLQLEKLKQVESLVIKYASVIGHEFSISLLQNIIPPISARIRSSLQTILDNLVEQGFLYCMKEYPIAIYTFQNSMIRHAIYHIIPPREVANIHNSIAKFIEEEYKNDLRPHYCNLAYHYLHSKTNQSKAFKWTLKSADQILSLGAFDDALPFARSALKLATDEAEYEILIKVINGALYEMHRLREQQIQEKQLLAIQYETLATASAHEHFQHQHHYLNYFAPMSNILNIGKFALLHHSYDENQRTPIQPHPPNFLDQTPGIDNSFAVENTTNNEEDTLDDADEEEYKNKRQIYESLLRDARRKLQELKDMKNANYDEDTPATDNTDNNSNNNVNSINHINNDDKLVQISDYQDISQEILAVQSSDTLISEGDQFHGLARMPAQFNLPRLQIDTIHYDDELPIPLSASSVEQNHQLSNIFDTIELPESVHVESNNNNKNNSNNNNSNNNVNDDDESSIISSTMMVISRTSTTNQEDITTTMTSDHHHSNVDNNNSNNNSNNNGTTSNRNSPSPFNSNIHRPRVIQPTRQLTWQPSFTNSILSRSSQSRSIQDSNNNSNNNSYNNSISSSRENSIRQQNSTNTNITYYDNRCCTIQ